MWANDVKKKSINLKDLLEFNKKLKEIRIKFSF